MGKFSIIRSLISEFISDVISLLKGKAEKIFEKIRDKYFKDIS